MMDNIEQMNKEVAEWLGICWHENNILPCSIGEVGYPCKKCGSSDYNPDFFQKGGIIRLLEEMTKHKTWELFADLHCFVIGQSAGPAKCYIPTDYITEDGKLLKAVHQWSKEHPR